MTRRVLLSAEPHTALPPFGQRLVLTPNPRAARALGVKFVSLDGYARRCLRPHGLLVAAELVRQHALREAVRAALNPPDPAGYTRAVRGTVQEVLRAGFPYRDPGGDLSERAAGTLAVARHYHDALKAERLVDPASVMWAAAGLGTDPQPLLVAGYPRFGSGEVAFLDAAAGADSVLVLPTGPHPSFRLTEELAAMFGEAGWRLERPAPTDDPPTGPIGNAFAPSVTTHAWRFASQEDEVRFVLTEVKKLLHNGLSPETIALVARDDARYGPLLHAAAWEYEVPLKASYARPLRETRLGAWLELLLEALRRDLPFEETARLLSHPLCDALPRAVWAELRRTKPGGRAAWRGHVPVLGALEWPATAAQGDYADLLLGAFAAFGVDERAALEPQGAFALTKLLRALDGLRSPDEGPLTTFLDDLGELLGLLTLPADIGLEGVELHTPLAAFGSRYEHVFVLGMAEGTLPPAVQDDPVLDFYERKVLAKRGLVLEGAATAAHRETLSFWAALRTARRSLTLTYPERLGTQACLPSPYFALVGAAPAAPPPKTPASAEEVRQERLRAAFPADGVTDDLTDDPVLHAARNAYEVERGRESGEPFGPYDGVTGVAFDPAAWTFSASQLVTLGSCAFGWFSEYVLKLAEPEEAEDALSPTLRGTFYHRVLEATLTRAKNADEPRLAALETLADAFAETETRLGMSRLPDWARTRGTHLTALRRVLEADDFWPGGGRIVALEHAFEGVWQGFRVRGVVDRIDETPDGLAMFDYKARSTKPPGAKDAGGKRTLDLQLPLYVRAAADGFPGTAVASSSYFSLTKARELPAVTFEEDALTAFAARVRSALETGHFAVEPDADGTACDYCAFDLVCRKGPRLERKRAEASRGL